MSFIWSDTGKKVAVALKCYPWLLFCLSCSDFSILAVTAFPKSLCFISKHRQFLHKICIALIAFFWLFNWSSLKMDAQELQWSSLGRLCIFSAVWNGKEAGGISEISFFFPLFSLFFATRRCLDYRHPSCVFSSELLFCGVCFDAGLGSVSPASPGVWVSRVLCGRWYQIGVGVNEQTSVPAVLGLAVLSLLFILSWIPP